MWLVESSRPIPASVVDTSNQSQTALALISTDETLESSGLNEVLDNFALLLVPDRVCHEHMSIHFPDYHLLCSCLVKMRTQDSFVPCALQLSLY